MDDYDQIIDATLARWEPDHDDLAELEKLIDDTDLFTPEGGERMKAAVARYKEHL